MIFYNCSKRLDFHLYACRGYNFILESEINHELDKLHIWLSENKLSSIIEESNFVICHPVHK